jgi:hypothetical protein
MPADVEIRYRPRISLRMLLLGFALLGVAIGVLGRLFVRNAEVFLMVVSVLSTIVPFLLGLATILWLGIRSPARAIPICGECKENLASGRVKTCPHCDADLSTPKSLLYLHAAGRRWGLVVWGLLLLFMPVLGMLTMALSRPRLGPMTAQLARLSTQDLIERELPTKIEQTWVWNELESRLNQGRLTRQEVELAVGKLITHMRAERPEGWDQPLHSQDEFIRLAIEGGKLSEPVLLDLWDAFQGTEPRFDQLPRLREGVKDLDFSIEYGSTWFRHANLGVECLWDVKQLSIDGQPCEFRQRYRRRDHWAGTCEASFKAGQHQLLVEIECAYIDTDKLIGLITDDLPPDRWPKARKRWKTTITATLSVFAPGEAMVTLVKDADRLPDAAALLKIEHLVAQADKDGRTKLVLQIGAPAGPAIPVSFDVTAELNDTTLLLGGYWMINREDGHISSSSQVIHRVDALEPSVRSADIIFTPNPVHVESRSEVTQIWGREIVFRGVPIERFDLETGQANVAP